LLGKYHASTTEQIGEQPAQLQTQSQSRFMNSTDIRNGKGILGPYRTTVNNIVYWIDSNIIDINPLNNTLSLKQKISVSLTWLSTRILFPPLVIIDVLRINAHKMASLRSDNPSKHESFLGVYQRLVAIDEKIITPTTNKIPESYFRIRNFEKGGLLYEDLFIKLFKKYVPTQGTYAVNLGSLNTINNAGYSVDDLHQFFKITEYNEAAHIFGFYLYLAMAMVVVVPFLIFVTGFSIVDSIKLFTFIQILNLLINIYINQMKPRHRL